MSREKREPPKPRSDWWCNDCKTDEMDHATMLTHLREVHGLKTEGLKCTKRGVQFLDGDNFYANTYAVTIESEKGPISLTNTKSGPSRPYP